LDDTVELLGKDDIKNLGDLRSILQGQSLKGLLNLYEKKQQDLETQLINLAKQKIANKKEARELVEQLEEH
jgi:hypothetical protein